MPGSKTRKSSTVRRRTRRKGSRSGTLPPSVKRHAHMLCVLARAKPTLAKRLIGVADKDLLKTISECSHNVLQGRIPLSSVQKKRLARYKTSLRAIAGRKVSYKKRKVLAQKGGFVATLLSSVVPLILGALSGGRK